MIAVGAQWLPLIGITYDPKDDLVEVPLEGLYSMIRRSRNPCSGGRRTLASVEIVGADGIK